MKTITLFLSMSALLIGACTQTLQPTTKGEPTNDLLVDQQSAKIMLNQVGYLPNSSKVALVPGATSKEFEVIDSKDNKIIFKKALSAEKHWPEAGLDVQVADFSELNTIGKYFLRVKGFEDSAVIEVSTSPFDAIHDAALKAYYYNRAGAALTEDLAGPWARPIAHLDTHVKVHSSAATEQRPEGFTLSSSKGWYDAGDYNKYIVNSGISTYTLLSAYDDFSMFYRERNGQIPESDNEIPDILDEIMWNLEWMKTMQDPNDGGVYHKLTTLRFEGAKMPHDAKAQRYVVKKSTSAALNFAAVMAYASRVFHDIPAYSQWALDAKAEATKAWQWAVQNPNQTYKNPADVKTGEYDDEFLNDEFKWAAVELYLSTHEASYLANVYQINSPLTIPSWANSAALGYISLLRDGKDLIDNNAYQQFQAEFLAFADTLVQQHKRSPAKVAMVDSDYVWGSNAVALNKAMVLLQAAKYAPDSTDYWLAARSLVDYVLGRNPTGYSYVTGFGHQSPEDIHHRQSYADDVPAPIPGFVAGGPHSGRQDGCEYPSSFPARNYADTWCSYSTNEVTINWNAPFVYVMATLINAD